ncbi:MAG: hypothetical protein ACRYG4_24255, partial [Janthinobacterium lividum]
MDYEGGIPAASDMAGPSWARADWPPQPTDTLTLALDAAGIDLPPKAAKPIAAKAAPATPAAASVAHAPIHDAAAIEQAAQDSISAMMLIRTYRVRGHLAANLDPLGLSKRDLPADLTPEYHGFKEADLDREVFLGGALGMERGTVRELVSILRANYCGNVGVEYMHINDVEERRFIQERIEGRDKEI